MNQKHVMISYAARDQGIAENLVNQLQTAGLHAFFDKGEIRPGENIIDWVSSSLRQAEMVIILLSKNTETARWQKREIDVAISSEIERDKPLCIVLRLDDTPIPELLGHKRHARLDIHNTASVDMVVKEICDAAAINLDASKLYAKALRNDSANPFRSLRAEQLKDSPKLHARTFASLENDKMAALENIKPCIVEGSRGTGKSMLLLSLRARNYQTRNEGLASRFRIFGFYIKLSRGSHCSSRGNVSNMSMDRLPPGISPTQVENVSEQELILQLIESFVSELHFCLQKGNLQLESFAESTFLGLLWDTLFYPEWNRPGNLGFDEILLGLNRAHRGFANFVTRRFIHNEDIRVPFATFNIKLVIELFRLTRIYFTLLSETQFVILLDEYENLLEHQKIMVHTWAKTGPPQFSVKIARKLSGGEVLGTNEGQVLQETHDYTRICLVYDLSDSSQLSAYKQLLTNIVKRIFLINNLGELRMDSFLPTEDTMEIEERELDREMAKFARKSEKEYLQYKSNSENHQRIQDELHHYKEASIYRALAVHFTRSKRFCGFDDLAFISSGVIRYFQEFLTVAYDSTEEKSQIRGGDLCLPAREQSKAIHIVSQHRLSALPREIEQWGEALFYFVTSLGLCLRHKLLRKLTEPEAGRITIIDPEKLHQQDMTELKNLLAAGRRDGIFEVIEGLPVFNPKGRKNPQPTELIICRLFLPALGVSHRLRWTTDFTCAQLAALLTKEERGKAISQIKAQLVKGDDSNQITLSLDLRL